MKEEQRAIHIRFNMMDEAERGLYLNLVKAAGNSTSLTAYVKRALGEYMSMSFEITERKIFHEQMLSMIREEMQTQGMKLVGALLAGIGTVNIATKQEETTPMETELPKASRELPEELSGILDLIG